MFLFLDADMVNNQYVKYVEARWTAYALNNLFAIYSDIYSKIKQAVLEDNNYKGIANTSIFIEI